MRNKLLLFIIITTIVFAGTSVAIALPLSKANVESDASSPVTTVTATTLAYTTPDVAAAEAAIAESMNKYIVGVQKQKAEEEAAVAAADAARRPALTADESRWDQLAQCETGGNWAANTGNGHGGGLQFAHQSSWSTWLSYGGSEFAPHPWEASREQQIVVAERVLAGSGWRAWPGCSRRWGWL